MACLLVFFCSVLQWAWVAQLMPLLRIPTIVQHHTETEFDPRNVKPSGSRVGVEQPLPLPQGPLCCPWPCGLCASQLCGQVGKLERLEQQDNG